MKKSHFLLGLLIVAFCSCKEVGPPIDFSVPVVSLVDTSYIESTVQAATAKRILLEEFTGVKCPNCPQGSAVAKTVKQAHAGLVTLVGIHPQSELLCRPFSGDPSYQDFRTTEGDLLKNFLGGYSAMPIAAIDRKIIAPATTILTDKSTWPGAANAELATSSPVNLMITPVWDAATRKARIKVEAHFTAAASWPVALSIYLTEDDIINPQDSSSAVLYTYQHEHVLRQAVTPCPAGVTLNGSLVAGRVFVKEFETEALPTLWNADNLNAVVLIHRLDNKEVLQVEEKRVK